MKIEICEATGWTIIWCTAIISFAGLMFTLSYHYTERMKAMFAAGYEESQSTNGGYYIKNHKP